MVRKVTTSVDENLWKDAMFNDVSWAKALKLGIEILLGDNMEIPKLKEEKATLEFKLKFVEKTLQKLEKTAENREKTDKIVKKHLKTLQKSTEIVGNDLKYLRGRTKCWNKDTGMRLKPDDFHKLCKRFEQGEFGNNSGGKHG